MGKLLDKILLLYRTSHKYSWKSPSSLNLRIFGCEKIIESNISTLYLRHNSKSKLWNRETSNRIWWVSANQISHYNLNTNLMTIINLIQNIVQASTHSVDLFIYKLCSDRLCDVYANNMDTIDTWSTMRFKYNNEQRSNVQ